MTPSGRTDQTTRTHPDPEPARTEYPLPSSPAVTAAMQANRRRDTKAEVRIRSALHRRGHRYRVDLPIDLSNGRRVRPDIVFTRKGVAIFIDGCFWHRCPDHATEPSTNPEYWRRKLDRNVRRDEFVTEALEKDGWIVIRIWEHVTVNASIKQIEEVLRPPGSIPT